MVKIQGFYNAVFKMPLVLYKPGWYLVSKFSIITNYELGLELLGLNIGLFLVGIVTFKIYIGLDSFF